MASMMGTREGMLPSIQAFPPLDVEQIARELRVSERAEEAGETGHPPPDAVGPDLVELDILAEIERRARKANEDYLSQRDLYEGRIRRAVIGADQRVKIEAAGQNALADFKARIIDDQNHLHIMRQEVEGREEEFRVFRERHDLQRLPKTVSPGEQVLRFMVLAVFVILESILNGMFFAEGSEAGLIGGFVQALVLSLLNVGVATLYARYGLPLLHHRSAIVKVVGLSIVSAFVFWLVGLNLAIGHFRDLFIDGAGHVQMARLLDRLSNSPLLLSDAKSGLLVLLGIGLGVLSVIDAAGTRDLYPGFAAVGRERQRAIERYAEENTKCLYAMTSRRDQAVEDMSSAIDLIRTSHYDMQLAIEGRSRLHQNYFAFLDHLAAVHERMIHLYRDTNCRARSVAEPAYFRNPVARPGFLDRPMLPLIPELEVDVRAEVVTRFEYYIKAVNEKFEQTLPEYQTVGQLTTMGASQRAPA